MTNQTNTGSASPVAVTAREGLVRVWCCGCTVLPPLTFFLYESPANGFKEEAALLMVCRQVPQSPASVDQSRWLMWQAPRDFLSEPL